VVVAQVNSHLTLAVTAVAVLVDLRQQELLV
jgi:hypothetical protein